MSADRWVSSNPLVDGPTLRCTGEEIYTAITSPDFFRKLHPSELPQKFRRLLRQRPVFFAGRLPT
jgi:hypothetical protein